MEFLEAIVRDCEYIFMFSWPRTCVKYLSSMVKFDANIEAVTLRQSVQLQMNVLTKPGFWVG